MRSSISSSPIESLIIESLMPRRFNSVALIP